MLAVSLSSVSGVLSSSFGAVVSVDASSVVDTTVETISEASEVVDGDSVVDSSACRLPLFLEGGLSLGTLTIPSSLQF